MCGICGYIAKREIDRTVVQRMNQSMLHRGPDGEGFYFESNLGLAMRRLSIIDLEGGWQPLYNEDKSLVLFMNGEIYNYVELREELEKKGHVFSTRSDAEVIVHLYEEAGAEGVKSLRGMFAIALWDKRQKTLLLARDRMGEKPLYLYTDGQHLLFASELRTLLASGLIRKEISPEAVNQFFRYQYIPDPHTLIKGVRKVSPATCLLIKESLEIEEHVYWKMEEAPLLDGDPVELMRERLGEIGRLIIRADVPVGVALSGGIDSGLVAALASRQYSTSMHAFTIGYEGRPKSDERHTARRIAEHLGLTFHELELTTAEFLDSFPNICRACDDPISDISAFGYYSVSKAAKAHGVPVLLQGQGGDELAWGYSWVRSAYTQAALKKRILAHDAGAKRELFQLIVNERISQPRIRKNWRDLLGLRKYGNQLKRFKACPRAIPFYDTLDGFNDDYSSFYGPLLEGYGQQGFSFEAKAGEADDIALTRLICHTYLLENGIAQGDRLSMSNSVELRLPLIDYKLVETVVGLRKKHPDRYEAPKKIFTDVACEMLPDWLFTMPKRGFTPPVELWTKSLLARYGERFTEGNLIKFGVIHPRAARRLMEGVRTPSIGFPLFFNALVLEFYLDLMND